MNDQAPYLVTMAEAARMLGVSHSTLNQMHVRGEAPFVVLVGKRKRVSAVRLQRYLHGEVVSPELRDHAEPTS